MFKQKINSIGNLKKLSGDPLGGGPEKHVYYYSSQRAGMLFFKIMNSGN